MDKAKLSGLVLTIGAKGCVKRIQIGSSIFKVDGKKRVKLF